MTTDFNDFVSSQDNNVTSLVFNELEDENSRDGQRKCNLLTACSSNDSDDQNTSTILKMETTTQKARSVESIPTNISILTSLNSLETNGSSSKVMSLPKNLNCLS
jgi:hypothetical protein